MKKTFLILATLLLTVSLFAQKDTITNPYHFTIEYRLWIYATKRP
jgi:hypothetical protein